MLATSWPRAFDDDGWWFEVKWDGYRAIVASESGELRVKSRRGLDLLGRFPALRHLSLPDGVVIDGEVVAFGDDGKPSFSTLQAGQPVHLVVFDLLYVQGDSTRLPYEQRMEALGSLEVDGPVVRPEPVRGSGIAMFEAVADQGMEGIVAKRSGSLYYPGKRSADWRKVSVVRRVRAVVGGYTRGQGGRSATFGSLLVGLHTGEGLRWVGAVGSGFTDEQLQAIVMALEIVRRDSSPFDGPVDLPGQVTWVEPVVVVAVEFKEWTADDNLRAPVFKGVEVIDPTTVTWESEKV